MKPLKQVERLQPVATSETYCIRVFARFNDPVPVPQLQARLEEEGIPASVELMEGTPARWELLGIKDEAGHLLAGLTRQVVIGKGPGRRVVKRFLKEIETARPKSAARWLKKYLKSVQVVFTFQVLTTAYESSGDGWQTLHHIQGEIWGSLGGILQADNEGFTNTEGYHILWQFPDDVTGPWNMAVRKWWRREEWIAFEMDLGNRKQRRAFLAGSVPFGVKKL